MEEADKREYINISDILPLITIHQAIELAAVFQLHWRLDKRIDATRGTEGKHKLGTEIFEEIKRVKDKTFFFHRENLSTAMDSKHAFLCPNIFLKGKKKQ